ncbi:DNA glycosylase AlkZ-like family protein [Nocardia thailandica]|uniref:DNA glycosylase AlkZ-like family protein n=1 Tax=Nocardia thailandica TaxID=257275 RepID=A0ABW6PNW4_9NOCA
MSTLQLSTEQVLAWRLRRQWVAAPLVDGAATPVSERLAGVQAQVASAAETAVAVRTAPAVRDGVAAALAAGDLVKTWTMRGTLHAMVPAQAAAALALIGSARTWEKPVWQRNFGVNPEQMRALAAAVTELLADRALTREELVDALVAEPAFAGLADQLRSGWGTVLKPLAWQGALCHGPAQGAKITFTSPARLIPGWPGLPAPEDAARLLVPAYLGAYGPALPETFDAWLSRNSLRKTVVRGWFGDLGARLTEVEVDGRARWALTEHLDELAAARPDDEVYLLGPFDQYVLGPGTGDTDLLPKEHRAKVSRTAGWISPLIVAGGHIVGTWTAAEDGVDTDLFEAGSIGADALARAIERVRPVLAAGAVAR